MSQYDSAPDTRKHIRRVQQLLNGFAHDLVERGSVHDASKLGPEEKPYFDEWTPKLSAMQYGSPEYRDGLAQIKPATDHHNKHNSHHPEFYPNGINGMTLGDIIEMFFDWKAASERHADGGNIARSIQIGVERHKLSPQLAGIFYNTAVQMGWLPVDGAAGSKPHCRRCGETDKKMVDRCAYSGGIGPACDWVDAA
jgi:hypothetical protein